MKKISPAEEVDQNKNLTLYVFHFDSKLSCGRTVEAPIHKESAPCAINVRLPIKTLVHFPLLYNLEKKLWEFSNKILWSSTSFGSPLSKKYLIKLRTNLLYLLLSKNCLGYQQTRGGVGLLVQEGRHSVRSCALSVRSADGQVQKPGRTADGMRTDNADGQRN